MKRTIWTSEAMALLREYAFTVTQHKELEEYLPALRALIKESERGGTPEVEWSGECPEVEKEFLEKDKRHALWTVGDKLNHVMNQFGDALMEKAEAINSIHTRLELKYKAKIMWGVADMLDETIVFKLEKIYAEKKTV